MKKYLRHFKAILLLIMLAMLISANGSTVHAGKEDFTVEVKYGFDNKIQVGSYMPVYVTVTNNGKNFEGAVQIIVPGNYYNTMHGKEFSIAAGDTKTIMITAPFNVNAPQFTVRIVDNDDDVVWKDDIKTNVLKILNTVNIGVLSDDYTALSYMADQALINYSDIRTRIYELSVETLPEDYKALDMLDVILVSNFSTDKLTEAQVSAIDLWVNNGGLLLLGSGSTVNKTFAGFNGKIFDAVIGEYNTYSTKFGLESIVDYIDVNVNDYDYRDNYFSYLSTEQQEEVGALLDKYQESWNTDYYENFFYTFYEEQQDTLISLFQTVFYKEYFGTTLTAQEWEDYGKNDFYYFVYDLFDRLVTLKKRELQIENNLAATSEMKYVKADILGVTLKGQGQVMRGEIENSDATYNLVNSISKGNGYIAVAGLDFTQNPMASYEGNKLFFVNLVESLIGKELWEKINNYDSYYHGYYDDESYYVRNLAEAANSAELPPMLIYIIIIGLYLVAGIVVYFMLKKRKKSMLFWAVQAGLAVVFAFAVYLAGFTTRKISPEFNVAVVTELSGGKHNVMAAGKMLMPKKKSYDVSFRRDYTLNILDSDNYYGYNLNNRDYDTYYIAENVSIDAYEYEINNTEALGDMGFKFTSTFDSRNDVDIQLKINIAGVDADAKPTVNSAVSNGNNYYYQPATTMYYGPGSATIAIGKFNGTTSTGLTYSYTGNGLAGIVTNNFDVTLEDAIIFFEGKFYLLGDIAPGESVDVAQAEVLNDNYYRYNMDVIFGEKNYGMDEFLFGDTMYGKTDEMRRAFYQFVNNSVVNPSYNGRNSGAYFFAFPSESDKNMLYEDNMTENVYEMVCKWTAVEDIEGITVGEGY
ncbi:MAG: hypothetical protein J6B39_08675 [Lachnospiraceae bacterium]|nr:hypothetical protein [Lachnospiraceae bacterium]